MLKKMLPLFLCLGLAFSGANAGENYTLSGDVIFDDEGDIYICLFTKREWQNFHSKGYNLSTPLCKNVKMTSELKKKDKLPFSFKGVPKGTYSIVGYQDVNGNGKVDYGSFYFSEPYESYKERPLVGNSTWDGVKFDLDKDMDGIEIKLW